MENSEQYYIERYGKEKVERAKETFKNATIQNDFIFCHVMQIAHICAGVLHRILKSVIKIKNIIPQSSIDNLKASKAVRLDILVEDEDGHFYDIEMQVVNSDSIPKRMRIYQASIDVKIFSKNRKYKEATKTIIIFICMFDPIGKGRAIYTFKNLCVEEPSIELGDETLKIIVVPKEWEKEQDEDLRALLRYIYEGIPSDEFTKEIDMQVADIKYEQVVSNDSMSFFCRMEDEKDLGIQQGIQKGIQQGSYEANLKTAKNLLDMGLPIENIVRATGLQKDEVLKLQTQ